MERRFLDHLPAPVVCEDSERRIVYSNRAFRRLWAPELTSEALSHARFFELVGRPDALFVDPSSLTQRASELLAKREAGSVTGVLLSDERELTCDYVPLFHRGALVSHMWSFRDVTEARRQALENDKAREANEAAIAARDAFLARMSHDLRSPLGVVLGAAQLLASGDASDEQRESLEAIFNAGQHLLQLIDDVLDYSKLRAGRFVLASRVIDLWALLDEAAGTLKSAAQAKGLRFEHSIHPDLPRWVRVDPARLRQLLMNLGTNAVKYTDEGAVRLRAEPGMAQNKPALAVRVEDTGPGISKDVLPALFDPYTQGPGHETRGTGLGLAIARELSELMGGTVNAESTQGVGSVFSVSVRIDPAKASEFRPASRPPAKRAAPRAGKILVAEDNVFTQIILKKTLARLGHAVEVANNGLEVIDALGIDDFDAVIMDCQMPLLDGYSTTARLRELGYDPKVLPIIAVTANAVPGDREKCLSAGMNDYLAKPFTLNDVGAMLERWVERARIPLEGARPPAPEESRDAPVDARRLSDLSGGDADVLADVCSVFVDDMSARLDDLVEAVARTDEVTLRRIGHLVAGSASNVGATTLESLARDIEHERVDREGLRAHVAELRDELERVRGEMNRLCAR